MEIDGFKGEIRKNEPLSRHTSFRIGGPADALALPVDRDDLAVLLRELGRRNLKWIVIGGGTNMLVRDGGFRGVVISLQRMKTVRIERQYRSIGGNFTAIAAEAGAPLSALVTFTVEEGLTGLEFAAGIPGTVGGAVCMNAGTAGGEFGDVVESVTFLAPGGTFAVRGRDEMGFGYRTAAVPDGHVVVEARIILRRDGRDRVKARVQELMDGRKKRQPGGFPNAGSVFKNPQEAAAGKLIETARLKGKRVGGAQVSDKHANFIVNTGNATALDVIRLMEIMKQAVLDTHGVRLEPEIKVVGED